MTDGHIVTEWWHSVKEFCMRDFDCEFRTYLHAVQEHCVVSFMCDGRLAIGMLHRYGGLLFHII